jgi:hypothetical protein
MKASIATPEYAAYSEPVGCAYSSNSYWRVWLFSLLYPDNLIECIWRSPEAKTIKAGYGAFLKGFPKNSTGGYCV